MLVIIEGLINELVIIILGLTNTAILCSYNLKNIKSEVFTILAKAVIKETIYSWLQIYIYIYT